MSESQHIEWKLTWRDEYLKWISGFANAQGGMLVIGKRDDGVVVGVNADLPAPALEYEATGMWTIFHFAPEYVLLAAQIDVTTQETTQEIDSTTQETTQENIQAKILTLLIAEPTITRRELAMQLAMTADGVKYHLQKLRLAGVIRHIGPTKAGTWEVLK